MKKFLFILIALFATTSFAAPSYQNVRSQWQLEPNGEFTWGEHYTTDDGDTGASSSGIDRWGRHIKYDGELRAVHAHIQADGVTAVSRYFNGAIDTTFGTNGRVELPFEFTNLTDMDVTERGDIYLAGTFGWFENGSSYAKIVKLDRFGVVDTSFDTDGRVEITQVDYPGVVGYASSGVDILEQPVLGAIKISYDEFGERIFWATTFSEAGPSAGAKRLPTTAAAFQPYYWDFDFTSSPNFPPIPDLYISPAGNWLVAGAFDHSNGAPSLSYGADGFNLLHSYSAFLLGGGGTLPTPTYYWRSVADIEMTENSFYVLASRHMMNFSAWGTGGGLVYKQHKSCNNWNCPDLTFTGSSVAGARSIQNSDVDDSIYSGPGVVQPAYFSSLEVVSGYVYLGGARRAGSLNTPHSMLIFALDPTGATLTSFGTNGTAQVLIPTSDGVGGWFEHSSTYYPSRRVGMYEIFPSDLEFDPEHREFYVVAGGFGRIVNVNENEQVVGTVVDGFKAPLVVKFDRAGDLVLSFDGTYDDPNDIFVDYPGTWQMPGVTLAPVVGGPSWTLYECCYLNNLQPPKAEFNPGNGMLIINWNQLVTDQNQ